MNIYVIETIDGLVTSLKDFGVNDEYEHGHNQRAAEEWYISIIREQELDSPANPVPIDDLQEYIEDGYYSNGDYTVQLVKDIE